MAENSCLRLRRIEEILSSRFQRSCAGVCPQLAKALAAASTAFRASSAVPSGNRPMTWEGLQGLQEEKLFAAPEVLPPMRFFPSRGSLASTLFRAEEKASRFVSSEKSVSGSFWNAGSKC